MSFLNRFLEDAPRDDLLQSVLRNLSHLLNARPGYGYRLRDYGVGDYLGQQGNRAAQMTILREIQDDITRMEPRLRIRELWAKGRDAELRLHVHLRGVLLSRRGGQPCALLILVHLTTGAVSVQCEDPREGKHGA